MKIRVDFDINPMLEACDSMTKAVLSDALAKTAKDSMMPILHYMKGVAMAHKDTGLLLSSLGYRVKKNYKQNDIISGKFAFKNDHVLRVKVGMMRKSVSRRKIKRSTAGASSRAIALEWNARGFKNEKLDPFIRAPMKKHYDTVLHNLERKFLSNLMEIQAKKSRKYKA